MTSGHSENSDKNRDAGGTGICHLAKEFDIYPDVLASALRDAEQLLRGARENVYPANKKALRGLGDQLSKTLERLTDEAVQERLTEAVVHESKGPEMDESQSYELRCAVEERIEKAFDGTRDLLTIILAAERYRVSGGRPPYEQWAAIESLLETWTRELGRNATASGCPSDPRGIKPSPTVRFIHRCMRFLGEELTEEACSNIVGDLKSKERNASEFAS